MKNYTTNMSGKPRKTSPSELSNIENKIDVNRVLVFKSLNARKQSPNNKPGNFSVKFIPKMILDSNIQYCLALDHLSMTASWHNIRPEYNKNKLTISKDKDKNISNNYISIRNL